MYRVIIGVNVAQIKIKVGVRLGTGHQLLEGVRLQNGRGVASEVLPLQ